MENFDGKFRKKLKFFCYGKIADKYALQFFQTFYRQLEYHSRRILKMINIRTFNYIINYISLLRFAKTCSSSDEEMIELKKNKEKSENNYVSNKVQRSLQNSEERIIREMKYLRVNSFNRKAVRENDCISKNPRLSSSHFHAK